LIKNIIEKPETIFSPTQVFLKSSEEKTFNL